MMSPLNIWWGQQRQARRESIRGFLDQLFPWRRNSLGTFASSGFIPRANAPANAPARPQLPKAERIGVESSLGGPSRLPAHETPLPPVRDYAGILRPGGEVSPHWDPVGTWDEWNRRQAERRGFTYQSGLGRFMTLLNGQPIYGTGPSGTTMPTLTPEQIAWRDQAIASQVRPFRLPPPVGVRNVGPNLYF